MTAHRSRYGTPVIRGSGTRHPKIERASAKPVSLLIVPRGSPPNIARATGAFSAPADKALIDNLDFLILSPGAWVGLLPPQPSSFPLFPTLQVCASASRSELETVCSIPHIRPPSSSVPVAARLAAITTSRPSAPRGVRRIRCSPFSHPRRRRARAACEKL